MGEKAEEAVAVPLLGPSSPAGSPGRWRGPDGQATSGGGATWAQTLGNIVVSIVGTGVLGLPFAFRVAGWLAGSLGVAAAGLGNYYCMLLLVQCRHKLEEEEEEIDKPNQIQTYGDLGEKAFGSVGRYLTELLILVAQTGGSVAYLVFIGQNLSSVFSSTKTKDQPISPSVFIFLVLLPVEIVLSFIRSLASLAPFSAFADACNVLSMAIVMKEDFQLFNRPLKTRNAFNGALGLPFAAGVAVFCFEGFSMTLALERTMTERKKFHWVLCQAFLGISLAYICFGIFGYFAYGDETKDIITLNLPNNWSAIAVKVGLCIALAFTFPIMMHPIQEILEAKLKSSRWFHKACNRVQAAEWIGLHGIRILALVALAVLASFIPGFGAFISFVGSTLCALLSFVLPASFHLTFLGSSMALWQRMLDYCILLVGLVFALYGTYDAISGHSISS
ncbi:amino acid transporter ANT1-like isoform X1 [Phoenix dactylifera]|uniref:Amino acid transporter ANT1-like isoform X1 n=1 Tax=Phoenix dactylifera TaxID=42345 RepID=A0A8B8ZF84_PHODC|nr:amino acid transporter ANT1-like isoform X1 [Phoenix dactylifera]